MHRIPTHRASWVPDPEPGRREDIRFYMSKPWRALRASFLRVYPMCHDCKTAYATEVHHVQERKARMDLALDWDNCQALCKVCHLKRRERNV